MTLLAKFVLAAAIAVGSVSPEFDPMEKISLDLRDASVTDVITMLGALANTPVSIAPDVTGTITVQVHDTAYAKVLELIGAQNGLSLRFENGKLVATRSQVPLPARGSSVPAPSMERTVSGPRLPVEAYSATSSNSKPLVVQVRASGSENCRRIDFAKGGGYEVSMPGSAEHAVVTQFGWDPVTRTRFLAIESPAGAPQAAAMSDADGLTIDVRSDGSASWSVSPRPTPVACGEMALPARRRPSGKVVLRMRVTDGGNEPVMAPQVRTTFGNAFSMRSGLMGVQGQHDETVLFGYVSSDGKSVVAALQATAIRTDPRDGREYVYSQVSTADSVRFTAIGPNPALLAVLPGGALREKPLELHGSVVPSP